MNAQLVRPLVQDRGPKPLGGKAYGSIAHLPSSRIGPGDHHCHVGQAAICTEKKRDKHDLIHVQEKLDGSCVAVANVGGELIPLGRAGFTAISSPFEQHHLFHNWAMANAERFRAVLEPGERLCGEWLALAHGTRYELKHEPFVAFDLIRDGKRATLDFLTARLDGAFVAPRLLHSGESLPVEEAVRRLESDNPHGAVDPLEGVMYRVERKGAVDFLAKWVRPDKQDGRYLVERYGSDVWNWRP